MCLSIDDSSAQKGFEFGNIETLNFLEIILSTYTVVYFIQSLMFFYVNAQLKNTIIHNRIPFQLLVLVLCHQEIAMTIYCTSNNGHLYATS